jgi:hypothetical protein
LVSWPLGGNLLNGAGEDKRGGYAYENALMFLFLVILDMEPPIVVLSYSKKVSFRAEARASVWDVRR